MQIVAHHDFLQQGLVLCDSNRNSIKREEGKRREDRRENENRGEEVREWKVRREEERREDGKNSPAVVPSSSNSSGGVLTSSDLISNLSCYDVLNCGKRDIGARKVGRAKALVSSRSIA
jgi:hypothetical protein